MSDTKMYYSRPTLISNWHKNREAEPKDYDFTVCPDGKKKLSKSTYKHFGTYMDADWSTSTETQMSQYLLKIDYEPKKTPKSMVEADHFQSAGFDRRTVRDTAGHVTDVTNSILPRHRPGHDLMELDTTYAVDYLPQWDYSKEAVRRTMKGPADSSPDYRKPQSQFTDTADYRRVGRNTWQDESGVYGTLGATSRSQAQPSNPICP
ncbi:protein C9orf135 isoform X2 [Coregonus clupeaformis]|uniref:protein C9orf135 isoform X2 n=1 Tax=Coregonus clupeaformis TaxID=59861 RepID=UPI001BE10441|nr:protein C9orf135 isoform X2 [Coregonus clupeaformis]